jgi:hypothetical protein
MEEQRPNDTVLDLKDELILDMESGGEDAFESESGALLLSTELPPEPVIRKIEVGPRVSGFNLAENEGERTVRTELAKVWQVSQPSPQTGNPVLQEAHSLAAPTMILRRGARETAQVVNQDAGSAELALILSEARAFASEYGAMKARTRKALYQALGRTYDFTIRADAQPDETARLIEDANLAVQDRSPYSPIVKLVFGADYDKTRVAEFAAAIAYGRRKGLPVGSFTTFLEQFEGGLKAVIGLERLFRSSKSGDGDDVLREEARPALASKLRQIEPKAWDALPSEGDEFSLLVARRLPDGSMAMVGEVPRDIALLERAARKLIAELDRTGTGQAKPGGYHPEEV